MKKIATLMLGLVSIILIGVLVIGYADAVLASQSVRDAQSETITNYLNENMPDRAQHIQE